MNNDALLTLTVRQCSLICLSILWFVLVYGSLKSSIDNDLYNYDRKYKPVFAGLLLPIMMLVKLVIDLLFDDIYTAYINLINNSINLIFIITVYYFIIFVFLKVFRKNLHPLVVSTLWFLPNLLYLFVYQKVIIFKGLIVLEVSKVIFYLFGCIWIMGFLFVMLYKIIEHFRFRNEILKDAFEIKDEHIMFLLQKETNKTMFHHNIKLMISSQLQSPLTVGLKNQVIVLPNINYTDEELSLIFKHEMIHIARQDVYTKFHIVFCNALCWFNPMMWIANKKCSEDLELSCDTSVLALEDDLKRKQYARLILNNVSHEQGFTTCLSANAKSLQYRLQNIIEHKQKKTGGLVVLIALMILVASWGNISIAVKGYHGREELFENNDVTLTKAIRMNAQVEYDEYSYENEDKIIEYLSNLELSKMPFSEIEDNKDEFLWLTFEHDSGFYRIMIHDHYIEVDDNLVIANNKYYYVKEGTNWEYLYELLAY